MTHYFQATGTLLVGEEIREIFRKASWNTVHCEL